MQRNSKAAVTCPVPFRVWIMLTQEEQTGMPIASRAFEVLKMSLVISHAAIYEHQNFVSSYLNVDDLQYYHISIIMSLT